MQAQRYAREVSSVRPWLLVILIDTSHSMGADWGGTRRRMIDLVEDSVNSLLYQMALSHCVTGAGIKDRVHLAVLTYGGEDSVRWALDPVPDEAGYCHAEGEDGWVTGYLGRSTHEADGVEFEIPFWVELRPEGTTPMLQALTEAAAIVERHCQEYPDSFPPTIINISDGEPTDASEPVDWGSLIEASDRLKGLGTAVGGALLCNVHLDALGSSPPQEYPEHPGSGRHQTGIWGMSSEIPPELLDFISPANEEMANFGPRRFYVYNADLPAFKDFLYFGTMTNLGRNPGRMANMGDTLETVGITTEEE